MSRRAGTRAGPYVCRWLNDFGYRSKLGQGLLRPFDVGLRAQLLEDRQRFLQPLPCQFRLATLDVQHTVLMEDATFSIGVGHGSSQRQPLLERTLGVPIRYRSRTCVLRFSPMVPPGQHHALDPEPERQRALVILLFESADPLHNNLIRPVNAAHGQIRFSQDRRRKGMWLLSTELVKERLKASEGRLGASFRQVSLRQQPLCCAQRWYVTDLLCQRSRAIAEYRSTRADCGRDTSGSRSSRSTSARTRA